MDEQTQKAFGEITEVHLEKAAEWARNLNAAMSSISKDPLAGLFFHGPWQGRVEEPLGDGFYLARVFTWIDGFPREWRVFHLSDTNQWRWFDSEELWREAGERLIAQKADRKAKNIQMAQEWAKQASTKGRRK